MSVSLVSKLPEGDGNGLEAIVFQLKDPNQIHVCICIVTGKGANTDYESGDTRTAARVRRIEVILDPDDLVVAHRLMMRALERRTGQESLPYDLEEEIRNAFPSSIENLGPDEDEESPGGDQE